MALKKLGNSYLVGASDSAQASFDEDINYRGWKDFLVWVPSYDSDQQAVITGYSDNPDSWIDASLYRCSNLLDDPGTFVDDESVRSLTRAAGGGSMTFEFGPEPARLSGLFRLRIKPRDNDSMFTVNFQNLPWYALECWEPRNNFYIFGISGGAPIEQYFFIPRLTEDDDYVRVRLQTGNNIENARLDIYTETGEDPIATAICKGINAAGDDHPWYDTARIDGDDLPSEYPGGIYRFRLTEALDDIEQPSGNTWVRFSKNVVPYFSGSAERLIYPILHQRIDPVSYVDEPQSHRLYLTVPRTVPSGETAIIPEASELKLKTGTSPESDTTTGFSVITTLTLDSPQKIERGADFVAQLLDGDTVVADSTDKVDTLYGIREPVYDSDFPEKLIPAWDNGNGRYTSQDMSAGHINTIQTSDETSIPNIVDI